VSEGLLTEEALLRALDRVQAFVTVQKDNPFEDMKDAWSVVLGFLGVEQSHWPIIKECFEQFPNADYGSALVGFFVALLAVSEARDA
jgi:hypothetical protein